MKTYHKPQPHAVRIHFGGNFMDSEKFPSKAAAVRAVAQYRTKYPFKRIEVIPCEE